MFEFTARAVSTPLRMAALALAASGLFLLSLLGASAEELNTNSWRQAIHSLQIAGVDRQRSGDIDGALSKYREALALARRHHLADPTYWERWIELTNSIDYVGDALRDKGDLEGAIVLFAEGLRIRRNMAGTSASNLDLVRKVGLGLLRIARVEVQQGRVEQGCNSYRESKAVIDELIAQHGDRPPLKSDSTWLAARIDEHCTSIK